MTSLAISLARMVYYCIMHIKGGGVSLPHGVGSVGHAEVGAFRQRPRCQHNGPLAAGLS